MMGETADWSPVWIGLYKANALTLDRYRHGRVLLAGDAAHLVPIFGVRGANSGIDDADNLAWKLAFVVKGLAGDELLETYSEERVGAAHENLSYGTRSTEFMAPPSFAFQLMREAVLGLAVGHPGVRSLINPRQTSAIAYRGARLNAPADDDAAFAAGPAAGAVLPECPLAVQPAGQAQSRPGHVTDLLGPGFTVLGFGDEPVLAPGWQALRHELAARGVAFDAVAIGRHAGAAPPAGAGPRAWDATGRLFPMYGAAAGTVYLVRPDGHVLGRWRDGSPAAARAAIDRALHLPTAEGARA
jgi:3-(3-hydroxy-phenyl)propionate hydroxylase